MLHRRQPHSRARHRITRIRALLEFRSPRIERLRNTREESSHAAALRLDQLRQRERACDDQSKPNFCDGPHARKDGLVGDVCFEAASDDAHGVVRSHAGCDAGSGCC
jgi:hypothetical protein